MILQGQAQRAGGKITAYYNFKFQNEAHEAQYILIKLYITTIKLLARARAPGTRITCRLYTPGRSRGRVTVTPVAATTAQYGGSRVLTSRYCSACDKGSVSRQGRASSRQQRERVRMDRGGAGDDASWASHAAGKIAHDEKRDLRSCGLKRNGRKKEYSAGSSSGSAAKQ